MSTKEYRIIPQDEELARQQRDLQFRPADPARARVLTSQQVADYNQSGYVRRFRAYEPEQILAIRQIGRAHV